MFLTLYILSSFSSIHFWKYLLSLFRHAWTDSSSESDFSLYTIVLYIFQMTQNVLLWQAEISLPLLDLALIQLFRGSRHNLSLFCNVNAHFVLWPLSLLCVAGDIRLNQASSPSNEYVFGAVLCWLRIVNSRSKALFIPSQVKSIDFL